MMSPLCPTLFGDMIASREERSHNGGDSHGGNRPSEACHHGRLQKDLIGAKSSAGEATLHKYALFTRSEKSVWGLAVSDSTSSVDIKSILALALTP